MVFLKAHCSKLMPVLGALLVGLSAASVHADPYFAISLNGDGVAEVTDVDADGFDALVVPSDSTAGTVVAIGQNAFSSCTAVSEISLPATIEQISSTAFSGCEMLENIFVDDGNAVFSDIDGVLCDASGETLQICPPGRSGDFMVPNGVKHIGEDAFAGCSLLTKIVFPPSLLDAADGVLSECANLSSLVVPNGWDVSGLGLPVNCQVVFYQPGGLDDPTLPPRWAVRFSANGGTGSMPLQVFNCDDASALDANVFTRNGYAFAGWARSPGGAVEFGDCQSVLNLASAGATATLYARWTANTYWIAFNANGGRGSMARVARTWDVPAALPANAFARTGYNFSGWAWSAGGGVAYGNRAQTRNLCATQGGTVTLYAKWTGVPYTVVFHEKAKRGKTVSQNLRYGTRAALRRNTFTKKKNVFRGWSLGPKTAVVYADGQVVSAMTTKPKVDLYAQWAVKNYTVRFKSNGGSGRMGNQTFTYGRTECLRPNTFKRTGYVFAGWSRTQNGPVEFTDRKAISNLTANGGRITLYARWRLIRYFVVFDANGGTGSMANMTLTYGQKANLRGLAFAPPSDRPRVFMGWSRTPTGGIAYANAATVCNITMQDGAVVRLYARWAVRDYAVHFEANGGHGAMADQQFAYGAAAKALNKNAFTRSGYCFLGWAGAANATSATYGDQQAVRNLTASGNTVRLYAVWAKVNENVILCMGDSITAGIRCIGSPYPSRLAKLTGKTVKNNGVGAKTSAYGAGVADKVIRSTMPGTVCILYGANDAGKYSMAKSAKENLRKVIRTCRKYQARPIIATPTPQIWSHASRNKNVSLIAADIRDLAREENVTLVDLNAAFGDGKKYLNPVDGLHLSNAGGDLIARKFYEAMR